MSFLQLLSDLETAPLDLEVIFNFFVTLNVFIDVDFVLLTVGAAGNYFFSLILIGF